MLSWWPRDVIAAGKLPLMLSFVVTFASTRTITRLIRDGRVPFRNVTADGTHPQLRARHPGPRRLPGAGLHPQG
jgi:hypothetical protein